MFSINWRLASRGTLIIPALLSLALCPTIAAAQASSDPAAESDDPSEASTEQQPEDFEAEELSAYLDVDSEDVDKEIDERYKAVEEILVTSQAGGSNLQDLGVSVAAFDAEYLDALGAQNIADISQFTPNLEIRTVFAASNPTLFIRGVGLRDFNANSSSSVAVYNDDIYMNSPAGQLGQLFDVQQVEVLRGPQGTLFGRNASAGAIRVISRKPTGDINGHTKVTYGNYNYVEAEGAFEVPITDTLTTRISGVYRRRDGTTLNRCGDPRYKDRKPPPSSVDSRIRSFDFDYVVHGIFTPPSTDQQLLNPQYDPYGGSTGCFNVNTLQPRVPISTGVNPASQPGQGWEPGWVGFAGFPDNPAPGPPPVDQYVNQMANWAVRGLLRWQPSDDVDWVLNIHGGRNDGGGRQFQVIGAGGSLESETPDFDVHTTVLKYYDRDNLSISPNSTGGFDFNYATDPADGNPYEGDYNINEPENLKLYGTSLTGDIRIHDTLLFKTISGYEGNERSLTVNLDGNPFRILEPILYNQAWQLTQEFKLIWEGENGLIGEMGANYLHEDLRTRNEFNINPVDNTSIQDYTMKTNYASAYAWMSWVPVEDFAVVAGGRFNYESKDMKLSTLRVSPFTGVPDRPPTNVDEYVSDTGVSGDISFNYKPTDEHLIFFKYSRGYKGPHINGLILNARLTTDDSRPLTTPVKPEKVDALELGVKTSWLDNTLSVNGSVFYYDYQNIQIFQLRNSGNGDVPVQQLINANDADIFGAEIEVRSHPLYGLVPEEIDGLEVFASFGWLNSTYTDFTQTLISYDLDSGVQNINSFDFSGNRLINSPEFAFSGYAAWPWVSYFGTLTARFDWTFKSDIFFGPENDPNIAEDAFWLMNIRVGYTTPDGVIELAGWVRNLTDKAYSVDMINLSRFSSSVLHAMGDPRTYGATLQVRF